MKPLALLLLVPALGLGLASCGSDDGSTASASASGSASGASTGCEVEDGTDAERDAEVHVTLDEWSIKVHTDTVEAGVIEFDAQNEGADDHELVILKGAVPDDLSSLIGDEGLDEDALPDGAEVVGEIEPFAGGDECHGNFDLAAGDYTLLCNVVDADEHEAHAKEGMVTAFTVT